MFEREDFDYMCYLLFKNKIGKTLQLKAILL